MKIQPIYFNNFYPLKPVKNYVKFSQIAFDSFLSVAFKGDSKFYPAKNIKDAIEYGKSNFGIKEYKGFDDEDLNTINWLNNGIFNLKGIFKDKPLAMPDKIRLTYGLDSDSAIEVINSELWLNKKCFREDAKYIRDLIISSDMSDEQKERALSQNLIAQAQENEMLNNRGEYVIKSPYSLIYHEMGHIQHRYNLGVDLFKQISHSPKSKLSKTAQKYVNLFLKGKKTIAPRVSKYATSNILEFVAETFAGLCEGVKYDDKVMELYDKLGGVLL